MHQSLVRQTSLFGALVLGLGSILGTGAYVSTVLAVDIAGSLTIISVLIAAFTALCNGLSSAQLSAAHPVSGGTYEYGYQFLTPTAGFVAGSFFIIAKSASAATAALAVGAYFMTAYELPVVAGKLIAGTLIVLFSYLLLAGVKRTNLVNLMIVLISLSGLLIFILFSPAAPDSEITLPSSQTITLNQTLYASALLFVAYTGYGRIATMGEEVKNPERTIPAAILITLALVTLLYVGVVLALSAHPDTKGGLDSSILNLSAFINDNPWKGIVSIAAIIAMCGVILNLILGISRVVLAMGRRHDLPVHFSKLNKTHTSAPAATWLTCGIIIILLLVGDIKTAWSVSAFTVLIYYGLTNIAALKVPDTKRFVPKGISITGMLACFGLAFFIPVKVIIAGLLLLAIIVAFHQWKWRKR